MQNMGSQEVRILVELLANGCRVAAATGVSRRLAVADTGGKMIQRQSCADEQLHSLGKKDQWAAWRARARLHRI
jgi:hypothetical protein